MYGYRCTATSPIGIVKDSLISSECEALYSRSKSLRRNANTSKPVSEPEIGAKGVPERIYFEVSETIEPLLVSLFEPTKGLIFVFQSGINQRKEESRYKTALRRRRKLVDDS